MDYVILQVSRHFISLTPVSGTKGKGALTKNEVYATFGRTVVAPLPETMLGAPLEYPNELAELAKAVAKRNDIDIKEVILCVEGDEIITKEYQHTPVKKKFLNRFALLETESVIPDDVGTYSIINYEYGIEQGKVLEPNSELNASIFAMKTAMVNNLKSAFESSYLKLLKIMPPSVALIRGSKTYINSIDKTIAVFSLDLAAVRICVLCNGAPIYCNSFNSPLSEIAMILAADRKIPFEEAVQMIRDIGIGVSAECSSPHATRQIQMLLDDFSGNIIRNLRMVLLSRRLELDSVFVCDCLAFMPGLGKYLRTLGFGVDIQFISDVFTPESNIPRVTAAAEEGGFRTASFFTLLNALNLSNDFESNLMVGINADKAKSSVVLKVISFAAAGLVVASAITVLVLNSVAVSLENSDAKLLNKKEYKEIDELVSRIAALNNELTSISNDYRLLPTELVTVGEIIDYEFKTKVGTVRLDKFNNNISRNQIDISVVANTMPEFMAFKNMYRDENVMLLQSEATISYDQKEDKYYCSFSVSNLKLQVYLDLIEAEQKKAEAAASENQGGTQ